MKITIEEIQQIIKEVVSEIRIEEKGKKQCIKGNAIHLDNGRFGKASDGKGSWSIGKGNTTGKDCDWGQMSRPNANRTTRWTKRPCGRSGKYRCKDGSIKEYEYSEDMELLSSDRLKQVESDELVEELLRRIQENNVKTDRLLRLCAAINQSAKGEYGQKK